MHLSDEEVNALIDKNVNSTIQIPKPKFTQNMILYHRCNGEYGGIAQTIRYDIITNIYVYLINCNFGEAAWVEENLLTSEKPVA